MDDSKHEEIGYVSLHNHTTFSILDSLIKPSELFQKSKELGQTAVAVTDHGTLAGMWDSYKASKETGVKLIAGCEFYFVDDVKEEDSKFRHVILIAKNATGYENLLKASAEGYDNYLVSFKRAIPRIDWNILEKYSNGLICLTACANGILGQLINKKDYKEADIQAQRLKKIFGDDLGLEVQAHYLKRTGTDYSEQVDQALTNRKIREIAERHNIRCVVTTDAHYVHPEQHESHDVLLAVSSGSPVNSGFRLKYNVHDFYIKSEKEVYTKLKRQFILDEDKGESFTRTCIENTKYFSDKCEEPDWIDPKFSNPSGKELPEFPVKDQPDYINFRSWLDNHQEYKDLEEDKNYLRYKCEVIFEEKYKDHPSKKIYRDRLEEELDVFYYCGVSSYMLLVADIIEWCKNNNVSVGPGRGSAAGSLVGYFIGIHEADPIKYDLVFERFFNKSKSDYGDIDTDFSKKDRHKVIKYIIDKYGEDNVAAISNYSTMTPKVYARAISRAFVYGGDRKTAVGVGTAIADAIPADIKTVTQALDKAALFSEYAKEYTELEKYAKDIGGQTVNLSTHAAGVVVNKRPLRGLIPIRRDKDGNISVEYEKERAESNGLVKLDILGLNTLDIIDETYDIVKSLGKELKKFSYDNYDKKAYDLISRGDTFCVFQLGTSGGTIDLCKKYNPKSIEDLAIITTLARPNAAKIRGDFFKVKNGEKDVTYLHPLLENAFKKTLGFSLYDESLLILTKDLAGWSLGEADILRKITKGKGKYPKKEKKAKEDFIRDSIKNGLTEDKSQEIWTNIIEPFSLYSFNKSHAVTYSMISYHTAWLKAHYPLEFLVANLKSEVLSNTKDSKNNITKIKEEIRKIGVKILPPDINNSDMTYKIIDDNTLMTGLDSLKYIGKDAIPEILATRPYKNFEDFLTKTDGRKVKAPAIQALAASGCLDQFGMNRKTMFLYAADYKKKLSAFLKRKKKIEGEDFNYPWPAEEEWTIPERCALERYYLGEPLSGDKVQEYNGFFTNGAINFKNFVKILPHPKDDMDENAIKKYKKRITAIQGEVKSFFEFKVKKEGSKLQGEVMAHIILEDPHGNQIRMTCFPDGWVQLQNRCLQLSGNKHKFDVGVGLYVNGSLGWYQGDISITFEDLAKFTPPPQLPSDLKAKKVTMRKSKSKNTSPIEDIDRNILLEEVEDDLANSGNSDVDEWNDYDFN